MIPNLGIIFFIKNLKISCKIIFGTQFDIYKMKAT